MASAERVEVMNAPMDKILAVLKDYESYSEFMDGVSSVSILSRDGNKVRAEYDLNVIKVFSYVLELEEHENGVSWTFESVESFNSFGK